MRIFYILTAKNQLIGKKVINHFYGEGTVVKAYNHYFSVDFGFEVKEFSIELFDRFFVTQDPEAAQIVNKVNNSIKAKRLQKAKIIAEEVKKKKAEEKARKEAEKAREKAERARDRAEKRAKRLQKLEKISRKAEV